MRKTWSIMRRDLLKLGRNPLTVFTSVLLPIIYLVIFGNSFQGVLKHLPVVIVSQDNGPYAIRVMEQMQALAAGPKTIAITYNSDAGTALQDVRDGVYKAALIIPPGFSHSIAEGRIGELGLFTDNVDAISAATLTGVFSQATEIVPSGVVLMLNNKDRPGIVGYLGTLMGEAKVNIASMSLSRDIAGGHALTVLNLDSVPPVEVLDQLQRDPDISNVKVVKL